MPVHAKSVIVSRQITQVDTSYELMLHQILFDLREGPSRGDS